MPMRPPAPVACRRSSASWAGSAGLRRWTARCSVRCSALRPPPRVHQARVRARLVQTPGGRSSDPTSGRSLLQVAPYEGADGIRRAARAGVSPPVRSERVPRLTTKTRSLSSLSRRPARDGTTAQSAIAKRTKQVTTVAPAANGSVKKGLGVVILDCSLVPHQVRPMPTTAPHYRFVRQGAFAGGRRSAAPIGWAERYSKICRATGAAAAAP